MPILREFIKGLGVDSKTITELEKAEADPDSTLDVKPLIEAFQSNQKKLLENDPDLVAEIDRKAQGKLLDIWTKKIRTVFNIDAAAIKDKKMEEVIQIAREESTKGLSKDLQTLQQELVDANTKVKNYEDVEIPKIKAETQSHIKRFEISNKLAKKIPVDNLRVPVETVDLVLNSKIASLYDIDVDDKGELIFLKKGTNFQAKSVDGTKLLTAEDVINGILDDNKFRKESNADDIDPLTGKKKEVQPAKPPGAPDPSKMTIGQKKAFEHAQALKKQAEEAKKTQTA